MPFRSRKRQPGNAGSSGAPTATIAALEEALGQGRRGEREFPVHVGRHGDIVGAGEAAAPSADREVKNPVMQPIELDEHLDVRDGPREGVVDLADERGL